MGRNGIEESDVESSRTPRNFPLVRRSDYLFCCVFVSPSAFVISFILPGDPEGGCCGGCDIEYSLECVCHIFFWEGEMGLHLTSHTAAVVLFFWWRVECWGEVFLVCFFFFLWFPCVLRVVLVAVVKAEEVRCEAMLVCRQSSSSSSSSGCCWGDMTRWWWFALCSAGPRETDRGEYSHALIDINDDNKKTVTQTLFTVHCPRLVT